jgi:hypothetical protein
VIKKIFYTQCDHDHKTKLKDSPSAFMIPDVELERQARELAEAEFSNLVKA